MIKGQGVHQIGQPKSHQDKQGHPQACSILFHRCAQHNVIAFPDEEDKTSSGRLDSSVLLDRKAILGHIHANFTYHIRQCLQGRANGFHQQSGHDGMTQLKRSRSR
jgi:hypothetical protein